MYIKSLIYLHRNKFTTIIKNIMLGLFFTLSSIFIVPLVILLGYYITLSKSVINDNKVPEFKLIFLGNYLVKGLNYVILLVLFLLPPFIFIPMLNSVSQSNGFITDIFILVGIFCFIIFILSLYIFPLVYMKYVDTKSIKSSLRLQELLLISYNYEYMFMHIKNYLLVFISIFVYLFIITDILVINIIIATIFIFYILNIYHYNISKTYSRIDCEFYH